MDKIADFMISPVIGIDSQSTVEVAAILLVKKI